ncbi:MAG TPA: hypothetical protein VM345_18280 [Acidimicrobiales bacterium]|nr:hypothetical protein [Acidimicrobiales bacterium]
MKSIPLSGKGPKRSIELHDGVTVVTVTGSRRDDVVEQLARAVGAVAVVRAKEVPVAPASSPAPGAGQGASADVGSAEAEAAVAQAEAAVADARAALEHAEAAYASAQSTLLDTNRSIDNEATDAVNAAEARLEVAQAGAAAARRALVQAREAHEQEERERQARDSAERDEAARLQDEKSGLEKDRASLLATISELGAPPEASGVEEALVGLRRLRQVKPKPSERAVALADRWVAVHERLASLPAPPAPPEWLVTPALAALHEAREALARAEATPGEAVDGEKVDAVERAHREVLEAEQRVMRKGSRTNKRRLEQTQEAERAALAALGVVSYGEYLQRIAPDLEGGVSAEERIASARAALADAEAVWEELHGGEASPEYTEAKEEQAQIRNEAFAVLGDAGVEDEQIEERLRAHVETVVDTEWAEQQLLEALRTQGVEVDGDPEAAAERWLAEVPARKAQHAELDESLRNIDARLAEIDGVLAERKADAFFGNDTASDIENRPAEERGAGISPADPFAELTAALEEAETAEREAKEALVAARHRLELSTTASRDAAAKEQESDAARVAVDAAKAKLADAEKSLDAARAASTDAAAAVKEAAAAAAGGTSSGTAGVASEAWLLARLAAARAAKADAPFVVDARAIPAKRGLRLLERVALSSQVVIVGDEGDVKTWANGLGARAAVRSI